MKKTLTLVALLALLALPSRLVQAQNLLDNGNLDLTHAEEIVPGFFLPKPNTWENVGTRTLTGPYEDEMSSEPWAGPAPTPVTTDGNANADHPEGCGGPDCAVFFKPFSGGGLNGPATGHLYQDIAATPGLRYTLTGWAGAEANFLGDAQLAVEFLDVGGNEIPLSGSELDLIAAGLFVPNGQPFNYKQYMVMATAPDDAASVRARVSMINGLSNPLGGGQAFVVDDFELTAIPEPSSIALGVVSILSAAALARRRRRRAIVG
ncbi:MAG: hypothetical protein WD468_03235 [Pirellulales bacterium]